MQIQINNLIQLVQENGGIEFAVVPGPESLNGLVDCLLVPMVEQVCDFSGPVLDLSPSPYSDSSAEMK